MLKHNFKQLLKSLDHVPRRTLYAGTASLLVAIAVITAAILQGGSRADTVTGPITNQASLTYCDASNVCSTVTSNQVSTALVTVAAPSPTPTPVTVTPTPGAGSGGSTPTPVVVASPSPITLPVVPAASPTPVVSTAPVVSVPAVRSRIACSLAFSNRTDKDHPKIILTAERSNGTIIGSATVATTDGTFSTNDPTFVGFVNSTDAASIVVRPVGYLKQRLGRDQWTAETCTGKLSSFIPGDFASKGDDKIRLTDVLALVQFYRNGKSAAEGVALAYKDKSRVSLSVILGFIQQYRNSNR